MNNKNKMYYNLYIFQDANLIFNIYIYLIIFNYSQVLEFER